MFGNVVYFDIKIFKGWITYCFDIEIFDGWDMFYFVECIMCE